MSPNAAPYAVYTVLAILLVSSALVGRRIPLGTAAKMALAWVAIFALAFALFTFKNDFKALGSRLYASAMGTPVATADGELRIAMAEDGHFWVRGTVNAASVRFLVDSGASTTTISAKTSRAADVTEDGPTRVVSTANGQISVVQATVDRLAIGTIERRDFTVNVSSQDDIDVLGMNFLSSLSGWRVEGDELVLRP